MDSDNDGVLDVNDICPDDSLISHADFNGYETILLDPEGTAQLDPYWVVMNQVDFTAFRAVAHLRNQSLRKRFDSNICIHREKS